MVNILKPFKPKNLMKSKIKRYDELKKLYHKEKGFKIWDLSTLKNPDDFYKENSNGDNNGSLLKRQHHCRQKGKAQAA